MLEKSCPKRPPLKSIKGEKHEFKQTGPSFFPQGWNHCSSIGILIAAKELLAALFVDLSTIGSRADVPFDDHGLSTSIGSVLSKRYPPGYDGARLAAQEHILRSSRPLLPFGLHPFTPVVLSVRRIEMTAVLQVVRESESPHCESFLIATCCRSIQVLMEFEHMPEFWRLNTSLGGS